MGIEWKVRGQRACKYVTLLGAGTLLAMAVRTRADETASLNALDPVPWVEANYNTA